MPSFVFDKLTNKVLGYSQTPVVVLTPDPATERAVVAELTRRKKELGAASTIDFVAALDDLVPQQQAEKQQVLPSIAEVLGKVKRDGLDADQREEVRRPRARGWRPSRSPGPICRTASAGSSWASRRTAAASCWSSPPSAWPTAPRCDSSPGRCAPISAPGGRQLSAAGEAMILADIIEMVTREMPRILTAAVISVLLVMALTLASLKLAVLCLSPTVVSIVALTGLMPLFDLQFNYLNIIVLTVLIGVTVDAGVHLVSRLQTAGEDFTAVYGETGRAICGGILTSAVGFGAMLLADHPGLNSIGQMANLGFATNLLVMLLAFPAFLLPILIRRSPAAPAASEQVAPAAVSNETKKESAPP